MTVNLNAALAGAAQAVAEAASNYGRTASLSSSSGVVTIDCAADADRYTLALTENITSWSLTNLPAAGTYRDITVNITQHASSAKTVATTGLSGIKVAGGAWTISAVLSASETIVLRVQADGSVTMYPSGVFG